jgi:DNA-binding MarR family transcriptional regulator
MKNEPTDKDFSKIPHCLIDSGILGQLRPSEFKVYLVLNRFAHYKTGISYPSVKAINRISGVNKNNIARATKVLAQRRLIEKIHTGKRFGFRNRYRVINPQGINLLIAACTIPKKTEKRKGIFQGKNGKFQPHPLNTNYPHPSNTESGTCPSNTDKKENLEIFKRDIKRDSKSLFLNKNEKPQKTLNQVTDEELKELIKASKNTQRLKKTLTQSGYDPEEVEERLKKIEWVGV